MQGDTAIGGDNVTDYQALYNEVNGDLSIAKDEIQRLTQENQELQKQLGLWKTDRRVECLRTECAMLFQKFFSMLLEETGAFFQNEMGVSLKQWEDETLKRLAEYWLAAVKVHGIAFLSFLLSIQAWFLSRIFLPLRCLKMTANLKKWADAYETKEVQRVQRECDQKREEIKRERAQFEKSKASEIEQAVAAMTKTLRNETQQLRNETRQLNEKVQRQRKVIAVLIILFVAVLFIVAFIEVVYRFA